MKKTFALLLAVGLASCIKNKDNQTGEAATDDPNKVLYNQVMDIHDEVMPRMEDIVLLKRELKEQLEKSSDLIPEKRKEMEQKIIQLDSAGKAMMDWMNDFQPEEYTGEELRDYLESEKERVTKVKELMLEAIQKAKEN
jgi:DNA-binding transcriptional MerR regulator